MLQHVGSFFFNFIADDFFTSTGNIRFMNSVLYTPTRGGGGGGDSDTHLLCNIDVVCLSSAVIPIFLVSLIVYTVYTVLYAVYTVLYSMYSTQYRFEHVYNDISVVADRVFLVFRSY